MADKKQTQKNEKQAPNLAFHQKTNVVDKRSGKTEQVFREVPAYYRSGRKKIAVSASGQKVTVDPKDAAKLLTEYPFQFKPLK